MNHKRYYMVQIRYHMVPVRQHRVWVVNDNVDTHFSQLSLCKKVPLSFHTIRPVSFPGPIFLPAYQFIPHILTWHCGGISSGGLCQVGSLLHRGRGDNGRSSQASHSGIQIRKCGATVGKRTCMCLVLVLLAAPASSLPPFGGSGSR